MTVVAMPDGTQVSFPDDMPKQQIAGLIQSKFPTVGGTDAGAGQAALQGFNSAVPFGERAAATIGAGVAKYTPDALGGDQAARDTPYDDLYNQARGNQKATEEANPGAYVGGTIGGIAATLPIGLSKAVAGDSVIGNIANGLTKTSSAIGNFARGGEVAQDASTLAKLGNLGLQSAKTGAVAGAAGGLYGYGAGDEGSRLQDAASGARMGATIGAALPVVGAGAGAAIGSVLPKIDAGLADTVALARKHNIPVSLDQVSGNRALKTAQKISQEVPLSGQQAFREKQMKALNRALFKTVGVDADVFTPQTMSTAFDKVGGEFDNVTKGKNFTIGGDFIDNIVKSNDEIASMYGKEASDTFQKEAQRVVDDFQGDSISGELISRQRARINKLARGAGQGQKEALLELENNIVDGITGGDEAAQKALSQAKQRYKNLIVLEPIATKAKGGMISPALLNNRVAQVYRRAHTVGNSGEIGDLARIGHELLPELGGSDSTQKLAYLSAIGGAYLQPATAVPIAAGVAANRAFQTGINRNQKMIDRALVRNNKALPKVNLPKLLTDEERR